MTALFVHYHLRFIVSNGLENKFFNLIEFITECVFCPINSEKRIEDYFLIILATQNLDFIIVRFLGFSKIVVCDIVVTIDKPKSVIRN